MKDIAKQLDICWISMTQMVSGVHTLFLDVDVNGELTARTDLMLEYGRVLLTMAIGITVADRIITVDIRKDTIILGKSLKTTRLHNILQIHKAYFDKKWA